MVEHSPFAYLSFIIYLKGKKLNDCSGLEKFVKERIERRIIDFFPNSTRELMKKGVMGKTKFN